MEGSLVRQGISGLGYDLKALLGLSGPVKADRVVVNGHDLTEAYLSLYVEGDRLRFLKLMKTGLALRACEPMFSRFIYPSLHGARSGLADEPLALNEAEVKSAARAVGEVLLGQSRFDAVRAWLNDAASQRLFDLETLQKGLTAAGWYWGAACEAVNTGLTKGRYASLKVEGQRLGRQMGFRERPGLLPFLRNKMATSYEMASTFLLNQYRYEGLCEPRAGDVFFDVGACCGDTAVWALGQVCETGTVVSFEPLPVQADVTRDNVSRQSGPHSPKVLVENLALGEGSGLASFIDLVGSTHQAEGGGVTARVVRLDDWCECHTIWPDFIKMDIEGAEMSALKGAEKTIRERKPRLAVCVYHKPAEDLWEIPSYLKGLVPSYSLYLKKAHPHGETVLFAVDSEPGQGKSLD